MHTKNNLTNYRNVSTNESVLEMCIPRKKKNKNKINEVHGTCVLYEKNIINCI